MTLLTPEDYLNSGLFQTAWYTRLDETAPSFVDVGARWGAQSYIEPFKRICRLTGFDADASALHQAMEAEDAWHSLELLPYCVWSECRDIMLNITDGPNNCSVLVPSPAFVKRYAPRGFAVHKQVPMKAVTLDVLSRRYPYRFGEVLKMDTQGAELEIVKGGLETIRDNTEVVVAEVQFLPAYEGTPVFSDVESCLRHLGFTFYGLIDHTYRSTKILDKRRALQRERFFHADAVFFRDIGTACTARSFDVQLMMAIALAYYDFALELASTAGWSASERDAFQLAVEFLAERCATSLLEGLSQLAHQRDLSLPEVMRYVDSVRDYATYADVA